MCACVPTIRPCSMRKSWCRKRAVESSWHRGNKYTAVVRNRRSHPLRMMHSFFAGENLSIFVPRWGSGMGQRRKWRDGVGDRFAYTLMARTDMRSTRLHTNHVRLYPEDMDIPVQSVLLVALLFLTYHCTKHTNTLCRQ